MESFGSPGPGRWVSVYADSGHAFIVIAGRAFDTADFGGPNTPSGTGPRWRSNPTGNLADGGATSCGTRPGCRLRRPGRSRRIRPRARGISFTIMGACPRSPSSTRSPRSTSTSGTRSARSPGSGSRRGQPRSTSGPSTRTTSGQLLAEHDVLGLPFETEYGGTGTGTLMLNIAVEEIAKACASTALILMVQELGTLPIKLFGTEEQKQRFLPRCASGEWSPAFALSEPMRVRTRAGCARTRSGTATSG